MRQYEAMYILDPGLEEARQTALVDRFRDLVIAQGATVELVDRWERRRLAYEVKGRREGYYVVMNFTGGPAAQAELNRVFGITDGVIRAMITKMDERTAARSIADAKAAAEAKAKAAEEAAAAAAAAAAEAAQLEAPAPAVAAPEAAPAPVAEAAPAEESAPEAAEAEPEAEAVAENGDEKAEDAS